LTLSDQPTCLRTRRLTPEFWISTSRRGGANAFFVTVQSAIVAALGFLTARNHAPQDRYLTALCAVGITAAITWFLLLRSYRDLNRAKFKVIQDLETQLPVALFRNEWNELKRDPVKWWRPRYAELGTVERLAPALFAIIDMLLGSAILLS
jgi:hypothetical protein